MKRVEVSLRLGSVLCFVSMLACSSGLPPEEETDSSDVTESADGGAGAAASTTTDGSFSPGSSATLPNGSAADGGQVMGGADAGGGAGGRGEPVSFGDAGLARGPGARGGKDSAPTVSCADLNKFYRDNAKSTGLFPAGKPVDTSGSCGPATLYETNDQPQQACVVALAATVASEFSSASDTSDYFKLDVEKDTTYTLDILRSGPLSYAGTMPVGTQTSKLFSTNVYGVGVEHREFTPALSGLFLLNLTAGSKYEFTLFPSTAAGLIHDALTYEPNNSRSTAAPVCVGVPVASEFTVPDDSQDFYELQFEKGLTYALKLTYSTQTTHSLTSVVDGQTLTLLPSLTTYGSGTVWETFTPTTSGPATLWLSGNGRYDFVVVPGTTQGLLQDPVTYEPNDTPSTYFPISLNTPITSELSSADDLGDYFGLQAEAGATYELSLNHSREATRAVTMPIASETQTLLARGIVYGSGNPKWTFTAPAAGLMLIYVASAKYTFQVTKL